jgi:hypothetical protein
MNPRVLYWLQRVVFVVASLLLSAAITWCLAYVADHFLWE